MGPCHQRIAVHPHETLAVLLLQFLQRIGNQQLGSGTAGGHVFLLRQQAADIGHWHRLDTAMGLAGQVSARRPRSVLASLLRCRHCGQRSQLHTVHPAGHGEGARQLRLAHGLDQVGHRLMLQRLQRVLVKGRAEDDRRWLGLLIQPGRQVDTAHARHAHIQ